MTVVSVGRAFINVYNKLDNKLDYSRILIALTHDILVGQSKENIINILVSLFFNTDTCRFHVALRLLSNMS